MPDPLGYAIITSYPGADPSIEPALHPTSHTAVSEALALMASPDRHCGETHRVVALTALPSPQARRPRGQAILVVASAFIGLTVGLLDLTPCRCLHDRGEHRHHRPGTDCSRCGCARFGWWR